MTKLSAGILAWRKSRSNQYEILLVHPGGPLFKNKDAGFWSIPKGEYNEGENALSAARREFAEETGNILPEVTFIPLQPVKIKSGKIITSWAAQADFVQPFISSNLFEMEWPPRSGKKQFFPETDKAEWFTIDEAKNKISNGQINLIEQLEMLLK